MKVLLAVAEKNLSGLLRGNMMDAGFEVIKDDVLHRAFLEETVELEIPDIVVIHDRFLPSEKVDSQENDEELLRIIEVWRRKYDSSLRVCIMCERDRKDPFLSQLAARNVLDIFNDRQIVTQTFLKQMKEPPKYINISKFGLAAADLNEMMKDVEEEEEDVVGEVATEEQTATKKTKRIPSLKPPSFALPKLPPMYQNQITEITEIALQQRRLILVVSPYSRSGSTFVAHQLARLLAENNSGVRYFENPFKIPYTFDRLGGSIEVPDYYSPYTDIPEDDINVYTREWIKEDVEIQALNPLNEQVLNEEDMPVARFLRYLMLAHDTPYLIIDIGSDSNKEIYDELVEVASHVFVVVDSDLAKLEQFDHYQFAPEFGWIHNALAGKKAQLVANRYVKGVKPALPADDFIAIPSFSDESVLKAHLEGTLKVSFDGHKQQQEGLHQLLELVLDNEMKKKKKRSSPVKRIMNYLPRFEKPKEREQLEESK